MGISTAAKIVVALLVAAIALAGCSAGGTKPAAGTSSSSASASAGSGGSVASAVDSIYYPVALGNTWTYRTDFPDPIGAVTDVETITKITRSGDDTTATFARKFHYENGSTPDFESDVDYVFHKDGSLTVPYQSLPSASGTVTVKSGNMVWPSAKEFEAGTPKTGTIEASITTAAATLDESVDFSIAGAGTEQVTVPFGTFTARKLEQHLKVGIQSMGVDGIEIDATTWLVEGVGNVKTVVPGLLGTGDITAQLVSFAKGK
ncbi:MAG: hypothetical protein JWO10_34 [Microbacteriaceae bacterium]|nr:hypothetical protein [Microbacteriaceae bacterium]